MKKVIFQMSVSLDGYVEGPQREIDWHLVDDEFNACAMEMLGRRLPSRTWSTASGI
jgi:hypothetical protein